MTRACKNCEWFESETDRKKVQAYGYCHVNPPSDSSWPCVKIDDWCSSFVERNSESTEHISTCSRCSGEIGQNWTHRYDYDKHKAMTLCGKCSGYDTPSVYIEENKNATTLTASWICGNCGMRVLIGKKWLVHGVEMCEACLYEKACGTDTKKRAQ